MRRQKRHPESDKNPPPGLGGGFAIFREEERGSFRISPVWTMAEKGEEDGGKFGAPGLRV